MKPETRGGQELWSLLPRLYRNEDESGDLARYVDAAGAVLDRIRNTLEQRLADCFIEPPREGNRQAQSWLLPYFADLFGVDPVSPTAEGRRREISHAVRWNQGKGTAPVLESVAQEIFGAEVVLHEGYQRCAKTFHINTPRLPAAAYGEEEIEETIPTRAARHPDLPKVTVDLRRHARAVQCEADHPRASSLEIAGHPIHYRIQERSGAACFPDSYQDMGKRTIDPRTPSQNQLRLHPKHLLLFYAPPAGFFPIQRLQLLWSERQNHEGQFQERTEQGILRWSGERDNPIHFTSTPSPIETPQLIIEDLCFDGTLTFRGERLLLRRCAVKHLKVESKAELVLEDSLFDKVTAEFSFADLVYCTTMAESRYGNLRASDCIFNGELSLAGYEDNGANQIGCIRYSRIPKSVKDIPESFLQLPKAAGNTHAEVLFQHFNLCGIDARLFGNPGYGCLHPAGEKAVAFGAEDGGEMGAQHHRMYSLLLEALSRKLIDFQPLGTTSQLIADPYLLIPPAILKNS